MRRLMVVVIAVVSSLAVGLPPASLAAAEPPALAYRPLASATRPYDTRIGLGAPAGKVVAGTTRDVDLGIDDPTVQAAFVNLTMVEPEGSGYLVASSDLALRPPTSNVNAVSGEVVANAAIVPVDSRGHVAIFSSVTTDVVVDVMGVFAELPPGQSGGRYDALTPHRLVDTREAVTTSNNFTSVTTGHVRTITAPAGGKLGVPSTVQAVALIVTGVSDASSSAGYVTVYPGGTGVPPTSNLNVNGNGDIRPNLVIAPLGADGSISLVLKDVGHVAVDVVGYFVDTPETAGSYHLITPDRQVDTRVPVGFVYVDTDSVQDLNPGGEVAIRATAISQNITMTNTAGPGFITSFPQALGRPLASNGNATGPGQNRASLSLTAIDPRVDNGKVSYYSSGGTDLIIDVTGYFD